MINLRKCAVIGCGNVGATIAYALMQKGLYSEMVLIDVNHEKAVGEAADLTHGLPFLRPMQIYAGNYASLADASMIIISAGAGQRPGQKRTDLVRQNMRIFDSIIDQITIYNKEGILLVVTNPVDILTYHTIRRSGFPPSRVIGSGTVLDTGRLKALVGEALGVDSRNVHSFIIGEHGDSELAVWSSANVSGIDLNRFCHDCACDCTMEKLYPLYDEVKNSAYSIIEAKGATYYGIAEAVCRIVSAIVHDEDTILPVSTLPDGQYGLHDLCLGLPSILNHTGVKEVLEIRLNDDEQRRLAQSANALRQILDETEKEALSGVRT